MINYSPGISTAALARGSLEEKLNRMSLIYSELIDLLDKHGGSNKDEAIIFIALMFLGGSYEIIKSFLGNERVSRMRVDYSELRFFA